MPRLKTLSGKEVVRIFLKFGFERIKQKGSHVKLRRIKKGRKQTLTIPYHQELDKGTLRAIYRQSLRYIPEGKLQEFFYFDK